MYQPIRKVLLIGAPGTGNNNLPGVPYDLYNMRDFLQSPRGGAWYPNEIDILDNPATLTVQNAVGAAIADYVFIYFSGHGYMDNWNNNVLSLKDYGIFDYSLFNAVSPRQLIIVDACLAYLPTISGIPDEIEKWQYADGYSEARALFDRYIISSLPGKLIMHSTSGGQFAYDARNGRGGEFTLALLKSIFAAKAYRGYFPLSVDMALQDTKRYLSESDEQQVPCITYREGNLEVPLAIISADFLPVANIERQSPSHPKLRNSNLENAGAATLLLLFLGACLSD